MSIRKEPVIKVEKGSDDFTMVNCEVIGGDRPALKTEAKNTQLIGSKLSSTEKKDVELPKKRWFLMDNPIVYIIVILLVAIFWYLADKYRLPLRFGSN